MYTIKYRVVVYIYIRNEFHVIHKTTPHSRCIIFFIYILLINVCNSNEKRLRQLRDLYSWAKRRVVGRRERGCTRQHSDRYPEKYHTAVSETTIWQPIPRCNLVKRFHAQLSFMVFLPFRIAIDRSRYLNGRGRFRGDFEFNWETCIVTGRSN